MSALRSILAQFSILAVCGVLLGAFGAQLKGDMPCPLCILQRMAMLLCVAGPAWLLCRSWRREVDAHDYAQCYGASILAAVVGGTISGRQVLLHIAPGDPGYGQPMLGMHLYSWAFVVFVTVVVVSGLQMLFLPRRPERLPFARASRLVVGVAIAITAANMAAVFLLEGFHAVLPDNPTEYRLLDDLGLRHEDAPAAPSETPAP
jgi:disulfide bond formation protein DsbB